MEDLYEALNNKVKDNVANSNNLKEEKRNALIDSQCHEVEISDKYRYNVGQIKAYYYYKHFIAKILPMLIKEHIKKNHALTMEEAKQKKFVYDLKVFNESNGDTLFQKNGNELFIWLYDYAIYKEFIEYLNAFGLRNGIDISNEYANGHLYYFNNLTIGDIINAYYGERQRLEFTDELIASIQEEENINVNGEELIRNSMKKNNTLYKILDYWSASYSYDYDVSSTKAYYYYKYFIAEVLPMLIKECTNNYSLNIKDIKQKPFDYKLEVSRFTGSTVMFFKNSNVFHISFGDHAFYYVFMEYLDAFCLRNGIGNGIDTSNAYIQSHVYNFDNMTVGDILNAYYAELQRLEYTDELVADIQKEENTNINYDELIRPIKSR